MEHLRLGGGLWQVGATDGMHSMFHSERGDQPTCLAGTANTMGNLATFLRTLRDPPEGSGSLLDRRSIPCTTELADGHGHSNPDIPILVAGLGRGASRGGALRLGQPGVHQQGRADSAARRRGGGGGGGGVDAGYVTEGQTALESRGRPGGGRATP